jgi:long-subunit acyl-CoA synthetase (AMP-forming)
MALTQLDHAYRWEQEIPNEVWITQPMGGGPVRTLTWRQGMDEARRMASYLRSLDLPPRSHIAIFSKNSAWWILADLAIWMAGHVSVTLFPVLTPETISQIIKHSDTRLLLIGKLDNFAAMAPGIPEGLPRVTLPLAPETGDPRWDDLIKQHEPLQGTPLPDPESMATIVYTSGSTGTPKGAMLAFSRMTNSATKLIEMLGVHRGDRYLSYLPLAHVFERWIGETGGLVAGFSLFFAEAPDTFVQDLQRAQPTIFISVPRLYQRFQLGVFAKVPEHKLTRMLKIPILRSLVRKKVLRGLGLQHVRFAGCGSAPCPAPLLSWYRSLGLELLEGYGMTENFVHSHVSRPGQVRVGYVGHPLPEVECRISDESEVQIKSPGNMLGYYKEPELTKESFTEDGFLKTGDQGEIDEQGRLRLTGRIKELFKTSKGKYIAPSAIENRLLASNDVELACVSGAGQVQPHGLIVLSEELRPRIGDPQQRTAIEARLVEYLKQVNAELPSYEQLSFLAVITDAWTPENGLLTPTLKLKRGKIEALYGPLAEGWYARRQPVIWQS